MNAENTAQPGRLATTIVGIHGSAASAQAWRWASEHLLTCDGPAEALAVCVRAMVDEMAEEAERDVPYLTVAGLVRRGHPADELIRLSRSANLVVVGAHGHGGPVQTSSRSRTGAAQWIHKLSRITWKYLRHGPVCRMGSPSTRAMGRLNWPRDH